ncbi:MAG: methionine adenosyltransferase [Clostridia bacterium]|nr:methionine adenosyltransferase [Clostridia bacterium]
MSKQLFTSESVTKGHPDKICDQISDAILDAILEIDKEAHVACEVTVAPNLVHVMGEITTKCYVDISEIVRNTIIEIGYDDPKYKFDGHSCNIILSINSQSPDIAIGVNESYEAKIEDFTDKNNETGAGDQGMMFGFACNETEELMPLPISLAHKLTKRLDFVRENQILKYLRPDGKAQVTVEYEDSKPKRIGTIVLSAQHEEHIGSNQIKKDLINFVIKPSIDESLMDNYTKIYINPTGRFVIGGPAADTGLTGRKIIVDTYGGYSRHGGGAFSGKDPTKVDRSAAYMARYIAKNIVGAKLATKCEVQIAYAIGMASPVSVLVDAFGTSKYSNEKLTQIVNRVFDLRPAAIINSLNLRNPIYRQLATYGHMGRVDLNIPWEQLDKTELLESLGKD